MYVDSVRRFGQIPGILQAKEAFLAHHVLLQTATVLLQQPFHAGGRQAGACSVQVPPQVSPRAPTLT